MLTLLLKPESRFPARKHVVPPHTRLYRLTFREPREKIALNNLPFTSVGTEFHSVLNSSCSALAFEHVEIQALLEESSEGERRGGNKLVF